MVAFLDSLDPQFYRPCPVYCPRCEYITRVVLRFNTLTFHIASRPSRYRYKSTWLSGTQRVIPSRIDTNCRVRYSQYITSPPWHPGLIPRDDVYFRFPYCDFGSAHKCL